jgi:hypothetical protein
VKPVRADDFFGGVQRVLNRSHDAGCSVASRAEIGDDTPRALANRGHWWGGEDEAIFQRLDGGDSASFSDFMNSCVVLKRSRNWAHSPNLYVVMQHAAKVFAWPICT